jgi:hypothetical protein
MWLSMADGGLDGSRLAALLLFREIPPFFGSSFSFASELGRCRLAEWGRLALSFRAGEPAETERPAAVGVFASLASVLSLGSLAGLEPGRADSDLLVDFRGPDNGAVLGLDERGFEGDDDLRSFSSLFEDLGVEIARARAERDFLVEACSARVICWL